MINYVRKKLQERRLREWVHFSQADSDRPSGPALLARAQAESVVVLAPHPDDEIIGCGGTLRKHCLAGDRVTVIYLTNGARGMDYKDPPCPETAAVRRMEAERAAHLIGIENQIFWDIPELEIHAGAETVNRLLGDLEIADPEAVFLPFFLDGHRDHWTVNRIFSSAVPRWKKRMKVYAYEVWTPLPAANCLVDISGVVKEKEGAMRAYSSQMDGTDYLSCTLGLNRFRSLSTGRGEGYFEAFFAMEARRYAALVKKNLMLCP